MKDYFETIVVPVYYRQKTDVVLRKVLDLSNNDSIIHLLCVQNRLAILSQFRTPLLLRKVNFFKTSYSTCIKKLLELKEKIIKERPAVTVHFSIVKNRSLIKAVIEKSIKEAADLIIIGKSPNAVLLFSFDTAFPHQLAELTSSTVLTVRSDAMNEPAKIVIVPVLHNVTYNRMGVLAALCKKRRFTIHLVTFSDGGNKAVDRTPDALLQVYYWLKTSLHCSVAFINLPADHKIKTMLRYAEDTKAEIILIDPELYKKIHWWQKHFTAFLNTKTNVSLLAVKPAVPATSS